MTITPRDPDLGNLGETLQLFADDVNRELGATFVAITADGAVLANKTQSYVVTKAGVAALTLAAPSADGLRVDIISTTAFAHTLTATGLLQTGTAAVNVATFAAFAGARVNLRSYNGKWLASGTGITFS